MRCAMCNQVHNRLISKFCSSSCKNKFWYLNNKIAIKSKYYENKETILDKKRDYYEVNKKKILYRNKKWKLNNKEWIRNYYNNRQKTMIDRIKLSLRSRLCAALKNDYKTGSAVRDLACSIEEFKRHLESKWQEGMSWDNYGLKGWHIDHVKPLSKFDLTSPEELKKACHYTNLQPLWAEDNIKKGDSDVSI